MRNKGEQLILMKKADITFSFFGTRIVQKLIYYGLVDCASEQGFKRLKGTLHDSLFQNYNPWFSGCAGNNMNQSYMTFQIAYASHFTLVRYRTEKPHHIPKHPRVLKIPS